MNQDLGPLLKQISDRLKAAADENMARQGLTISQARLLGFVGRSGGSVMQRDIEGFLSVSHPTVVGIVSRLEKKGFVSCRTDECDRRNKLVSLTEKTEEMWEQLRAEMAEEERWLVRGLSQEEEDTLLALLRRILANLEEDPRVSRTRGGKEAERRAKLFRDS